MGGSESVKRGNASFVTSPRSIVEAPDISEGYYSTRNRVRNRIELPGLESSIEYEIHLPGLDSSKNRDRRCITIIGEDGDDEILESAHIDILSQTFAPTALTAGHRSRASLHARTLTNCDSKASLESTLSREQIESYINVLDNKVDKLSQE
jgi:hypothetical protein